MTDPEQEDLTYWYLLKKTVYILVMCGPFALFALLVTDDVGAAVTLLSAFTVGTLSWVDGFVEAQEAVKA